jgi:hypothetical protein
VWLRAVAPYPVGPPVRLSCQITATTTTGLGSVGHTAPGSVVGTFARSPDFILATVRRSRSVTQIYPQVGTVMLAPSQSGLERGNSTAQQPNRRPGPKAVAKSAFDLLFALRTLSPPASSAFLSAPRVRPEQRASSGYCQGHCWSSVGASSDSHVMDALVLAPRGGTGGSQHCEILARISPCGHSVAVPEAGRISSWRADA